MNFNLSSPATSGGPNFPKNEHLDHLILFLGPIERRELETSFGPGTAAHVPTLICTDCIESWADQLVFGAALEPRLTGEADAEVVVGRLGQGFAKPGRNAPWTLDDPTEADLAEAEAFLEKYATRLPSGTIVIDEAAMRADRPEPEAF